MSTEPDLVDQLVNNYPHRTLESIETDLSADEILEGYLEYQGTDNYELMESNHPYHAALGWASDSDGYIILTSRYTYPDETGISKDHTRASTTVENVDETLERDIINSDKILDAAGAELLEDKKTKSREEELRPEAVHCVVFYDRPVVSATESTEYENQVHKSAAMQSLNEPSLATALIHTGKNQDGEDLTGVQIDYWTRTIDGLAEDGIDYTEINWENPTEI